VRNSRSSADNWSKNDHAIKGLGAPQSANSRSGLNGDLAVRIVAEVNGSVRRQSSLKHQTAISAQVLKIFRKLRVAIHRGAWCIVRLETGRSGQTVLKSAVVDIRHEAAMCLFKLRKAGTSAPL
jgi:hypothetical protein